jgi:hypothetical protein
VLYPNLVSRMAPAGLLSANTLPAPSGIAWQPRRRVNLYALWSVLPMDRRAPASRSSPKARGPIKVDVFSGLLVSEIADSRKRVNQSPFGIVVRAWARALAR